MKVIESGIRDVEKGKNVNVVMPEKIYECELGDNVLSDPLSRYKKDVLSATGPGFSPTPSSLRTLQ